MRILTPTFILLCCFVAPLAGIAQQAYKPGYVVLSNNDTLSGFIKVQNSRKATQVAVFRKEIKGTKEFYTPNQIKAYRYDDGKYYVSFSVMLDGEQKQVFMEYLIKGKANVYYTHDGDEHFYIQKEGGELTELSEPITYTIVNGKRYATPPKYKNKLNSILSDADMQPSIQKTSLEYKSLISLAKEYHEKVCDTEACIVYSRTKNKIIRDYTVFVGYSANHYKFGNALVSDYAGGLQAGFLANLKGLFFSNEKLGISFGAFFEKDFSFILRPRQNNRVNVVNYEGERYYLSTPSSGVYIPKLDVNANVTALRIPLTINYYQPVKRSSFIFGLGASNRILLSRNKDFKILIISGPTEEYKTLETYFLGCSGFIGYETKIHSSNRLTFNLAGDYVVSASTEKLSANRVSIAQFTGRIGFTF